MTLSDLISKLESAEEGSREMDKEIAIFAGTIMAAYEEVHIESRSYSIYPEDWPRYTTSIDSAVALIPEGLAAFFNMGHRFGTDRTLKECFAGFETVAAPYYFGARVKTFPLAICIAALKAIQHREDNKP